MYVEATETKSGETRLAFLDLTVDETELLQHGLIELKAHSLQDAETFSTQRNSCVDMFRRIDVELIKSRQCHR